ncbi:tetratricopeptide repeat protein [Amycolatopsis sp. NPDC051071]|uniref:tetratricopeptide repeat protein n=1 Tax=Amycolatopsis sp. NPDC051071 TaxID=3154637 RepID=UPI003437F185
MTDPEAATHRPRDRVEARDVEALETQTRALRAVDYRYGGGICRDAVLARIRRGHRMLGMPISGSVRPMLLSAVADLHNLAGWTCFDSGRAGEAHHHLALALSLADDGGDDELAANIHYRRGRVHLHHGAPDEALAQFRLGRLAAKRSGSKLAASILSANEGWAHAKKGEVDLAVGLLDRAGEEFAGKSEAKPPDWARFFTEVDVSAMAGSIHTDLALHLGGRHVGLAISSLTDAVERYGPEMRRSRSLCLIMLATGHVLAGDCDQALAVGVEALETAGALESARTRDRLRPLEEEVAKHLDDPDCRTLSEAITQFAGSSHT